MASEKDILKELLVDEKDIVEDLSKLVEKAKDIFVIEKSSGKVIFKNYGGMTDWARIVSLLIGRFFAVKLEILTDSTMSISEIASSVGRPNKIVSNRLAELAKKGYVEKTSNRRFRIAYHRIPEAFEAFLGDKKNG